MSHFTWLGIVFQHSFCLSKCFGASGPQKAQRGSFSAEKNVQFKGWKSIKILFSLHSHPGLSDPRVHLSLDWELAELGTSCGVEKIPLWVIPALSKAQPLGLMESLQNRTRSCSNNPHFSLKWHKLPFALCGWELEPLSALLWEKLGWADIGADPGLWDEWLRMGYLFFPQCYWD